MQITKRLSVHVVVGLALLACPQARAQEQRAALEGVVRDTQGAAVPGVAVLVQSPTGVSVETITDGAGVYRFASLRPGRYELTARLSGFAPARVVNVDLRLGQQLEIDVALQPASLAETIEVVSESPLVAITQSVHATNLRGEEIEKMPRGRDFTSLATQAAGVNNEQKMSGLSIDGSTSAENRVVIDGVETTNTLVGTPGQYLVTDFVEELQVKSSGYSAEYGGSTGGVLNAITRSGGNGWHGDALLYWSGDALDAGPRPTLQLAPSDTSRAEYVTFPEDDYDQLEPGFTLGGPIVRDRLWFFAGYVPSFRPLDRSVTFLADGTTGSFRQDLVRHHAALNLTSQLGPRWRAKATFSTGRQAQRGLLPASDGSGSPAADYSIDEITPNYSVSASVDFSPSSRALLSLRTGYFFRDLYNEGVYRGDRYAYQTSSLGLPGVPVEYQQPRGYANVPTNRSQDRGKGPHLAVQLDGTIFFTAAGQHQLKGGAQLDRVGLDVFVGGTGNGITVFWGQAFAGSRGPYGYYFVNSNSLFPNLGLLTAGEATVSNLGLFLQDAWTIGTRLTLHLGLRTENEDVPSLSRDPRIPETAIHFGFGDKLAPRAGFAWDATGDGKTKLYGSWGVFYDITKLQLSYGFGGIDWMRHYYTLDTGDIGAIVDNPDCPPACPGRLIRGSVGLSPPLNDPDANHIDPDLAQMRLQEFVVGVERELAPSLSVTARYVHKQVDRAVEDLGALDAQQTPVYWIGNPGFGKAASFYPAGGTTPLPFPKAVRDYDAVELALDKRHSGNWSARVSYTWSRLYGNYSGLAQSDEDGRVEPNIGLNFDYPLMSFDERGEPVYGVLATDRPHQLKAHLLFDLPFGTSLGARVFGASGIPRTRVAQFVVGYDVMYRGRNSDGRLPFLSQLDLYLQHQFRLGDRLRLTLSANVINALDQGTATDYYARELFAGQAIQVDEVQFYSTGVDTQALIAQQRLVRDARFLMDSGHQAPRSIRLGFKLGF
jgi:hypothetical protein